MFMKFKISCTCHCEYTISEDLSTDKIVCPNCGMEHPHSDKLVSILNTAKEIPNGELLSDEVKTGVISFSEDMNLHQQ